MSSGRNGDGLVQPIDAADGYRPTVELCAPASQEGLAADEGCPVSAVDGRGLATAGRNPAAGRTEVRCRPGQAIDPSRRAAEHEPERGRALRERPPRRGEY